MINYVRLTLLLCLFALGWPAAAGSQPSAVVEQIAVARGVEAALRTEDGDCAYGDWCCHCLGSARADLAAAPERRNPTPFTTPAVCLALHASAMLAVERAGATIAAQAAVPRQKLPLYLLHLSLRR